jgi:hypothetical protein
MQNSLRNLSLALSVLLLSTSLSGIAQETASNPAMEKFRQDMKTALLNGSLTIPQARELQTNAEILKNARAEQTPGAPIDLLTPYRAVANMKAIMAKVNPRDRETLQGDLQAVLASKHQAASPTATPPTPGQKLGKDIFKAVMFGNPTEPQVKQLQDSLNSLQSIKSKGGRPLQEFQEFNTSKAQIETVMNTGAFRPEDRQVVLDDLNNLGPEHRHAQAR